MAQKSPAGGSFNFPYRDLTSEVTRRRFTMTAREEILTKKCSKAREMVSDSDYNSVQALLPNTDYPMVPPAPPPSPAEDSTSN